jgi:two-component system CheB/CheR fusion protein
MGDMASDTDALLRRWPDHAKDIALMLLDRDGRVLWWSRGAERVFGHRAETIVGDSSARLFTDEDVRRALPEQERAIAGKDGTAEDDRWMVRADGSRFWAAGSLVAIRDDDGTLVAFGKLVRNQTEIRAQIETLQNRLDELEQACRRKDVFLSTLSHELRNPLAPLVSAVHLVRHAAGDRSAIEQPIRIIERQIDVFRRLVDDLLDVTRIASGKLALRTERVDIGDVLDRAVDATRPIVDRHCHTLDVFKPAIPMIVMADADRLEQVFVNLLTNAARYTPDGGHIWVKATPEGNEAVVRVEDTGIGIETAMLPRIFDLFTQAGAPEMQPQEGLGIGLSVVKDLVALHGGSVQATSDGPGRGSEFAVRLPLERD